LVTVGDGLSVLGEMHADGAEDRKSLPGQLDWPFDAQMSAFEASAEPSVGHNSKTCGCTCIGRLHSFRATAMIASCTEGELNLAKSDIA
jgi:hypothetical protein